MLLSHYPNKSIMMLFDGNSIRAQFKSCIFYWFVDAQNYVPMTLLHVYMVKIITETRASGFPDWQIVYMNKKKEPIVESLDWTAIWLE